MDTYPTTIKTIAKLKNPPSTSFPPSTENTRLILQGGRVVDPRNQVDRVADLTVRGGVVEQVADAIERGTADRVLDCRGLVVALLDTGHAGLLDFFPRLCHRPLGIWRYRSSP